MKVAYYNDYLVVHDSYINLLNKIKAEENFLYPKIYFKFSSFFMYYSMKDVEIEKDCVLKDEKPVNLLYP